MIERVDDDAEAVELADDIPGPSYSTTMPLHLRLGASYVVRACNDQGCSESEPLRVEDSMAGAVGYVKASNPGEADRFGTAIALSRDGTTLAVGVPEEDSSASGIDGDQADNTADEAGAVYVFVRSGDGWSQQAYIKASGAAAGDRFGWHLALSDDGDTLAVSAPFEDSVPGIPGTADIDSDYGAVYVFARSDGAWSEQHYFAAAAPILGDYFGSAVALSGDGDTLVVGVDGENKGGVVDVWRRNSGQWSYLQRLRAADRTPSDVFGNRLSLSIDGATLAIGAYVEDSSATGTHVTEPAPGDHSAPFSGAVYVFTRSADSYQQQSYIKASNSGQGDRFGATVALAGDGQTLAVGAYLEDSTATGIGGGQTTDPSPDTNSGAVYVFRRSGDTWSQQAYVKATNTGPEDRFGHSVALSAAGDVLAVGAIWEDSGGNGITTASADDSRANSGAVYVYSRAGDQWAPRSFVKAANADAGDQFGSSVALSADGSLLAVGATGERGAAIGVGGDGSNNATPSAGAVYLY